MLMRNVVFIKADIKKSVSSSNCIKKFPASITASCAEFFNAHNILPAGTDKGKKRKQIEYGFTNTWSC